MIQNITKTLPQADDHRSCPDLDPDSCEPWRARIVQLIQFYEYDVHPQARQQGIYISSSLASRVPDGDLWHVVGDIHQHQLVLDVRRELSLQWYRLELYEVIGVIPNNRNIRRFEQLMRNTPPPGPGLLGGNNQDWTRKVLEIGLARCLIIPIGRLLMDPEWN